MSNSFMDVSKAKISTIDEYINSFPKEIQDILETLRQVIKEQAPEARETINYQIPTFVLHGNLVHFAAYKNHIGFYPTPSAVVYFQKELSKYKTSKGAIQFPIHDPLPITLIRKMVSFRVKEVLNRERKKKYGLYIGDTNL
jgi:uncharacterized protein YdhG (YjbR/CyaY superfamily)